MDILLGAAADLFLNYNLGVVLFIIVGVATILLGCIKGYDYLKARSKNRNKDESEQEKRLCQIENTEIANKKDIMEMKNDIEDLRKNIELLIESDKNSIRGYITEKYHECIQQGYIGDFMLDDIERRYKCYHDVGGNGFIDDMMEKIRKLPHKPE